MSEIIRTANNSRLRQIGAVGTTARVVIGVPMLLFGALGGRFVFDHGPQLKLDAPALILGLVAFPAVLFAWQLMRFRRNPARLEATGPEATVVNILVFAFLVGLSSVPAISFLGFAAFVFYGASLLLAGARGYAGCEVLAASNWLLRRDDQIGCLVLSPVDEWERSYRATRPV